MVKEITENKLREFLGEASKVVESSSITNNDELIILDRVGEILDKINNIISNPLISKLIKVPEPATPLQQQQQQQIEAAPETNEVIKKEKAENIYNNILLLLDILVKEEPDFKVIDLMKQLEARKDKMVKEFEKMI